MTSTLITQDYERFGLFSVVCVSEREEEEEDVTWRYFVVSRARGFLCSTCMGLYWRNQHSSRRQPRGRTVRNGAKRSATCMAVLESLCSGGRSVAIFCGSEGCCQAL
jgi:hypothetical protein